MLIWLVFWCRADAGKVELVQTQYLGFTLPFDITQITWLEVLLVGGAEVYRNTELDTNARIYPGTCFHQNHNLLLCWVYIGSGLSPK